MSNHSVPINSPCPFNAPKRRRDVSESSGDVGNIGRTPLTILCVFSRSYKFWFSAKFDRVFPYNWYQSLSYGDRSKLRSLSPSSCPTTAVLGMVSCATPSLVT
ncbi:unnamed protein product [Brassica oleracea]